MKCDLQLSIYEYNEENLGSIISLNNLSQFNSSKVIPIKLIAEAYLSLASKLKDTIFEKFEAQSIMRRFDKIGWHNGKSIAEIKGEISIETSPYIRQTNYGVLTESGFSKSNYVLPGGTVSSKRIGLHPKIKEISNLTSTLVDSSYNFVNKKGKKRDSINSYKERINVTIIAIKALLEEPKGNLLNSLVYKGKGELYKAQEVFINLAEHLIDYYNEVDSSMSAKYLELINLINKRGELSLQSLRFNSEEKRLLLDQKGKIQNKLLKYKLSVSLAYQRIFYRFLKTAISTSEHKSIPEKERTFVESIISSSFIKIPEFRKELLKCLTDWRNNRTIVEWNKLQYRFDDKMIAITSEFKDTSFASLFDWEKDFSEPLSNQEEYITIKNSLIAKLGESGWKDRFKNIKIEFFRFVREICSECRDISALHSKIEWESIPGYGEILHTFLIKFKDTEVNKLPDSLIDASIQLLHNNSIFSVFIEILLTKTKYTIIYPLSAKDYTQVIKCFEILDQWFRIYRTRDRRLPPEVNLYIILEAVQVVIESEQCFSISKMLEFLYNNIVVFPIKITARLCEIIFGSMFFKLFAHWSYSVRQSFQHLILYRLYHYCRFLSSRKRNIEYTNPSNIES